MKKPFKYLALASALAASSAFATLPATAQLNLGVGVKPEVDVRVGRAEPPRREVHRYYVYEGYHSGEWYPEERVHRSHRWNARHDGYDCYDAFQYTWENGERVRYESTWCYDEFDRPYEARGTRVVVRID